MAPVALLLALLVAAPPAPPPAPAAPAPWRELGQGIEYATFPMVLVPKSGDGRLHVVRITPGQASLQLLLASEHGEKLRTAAGWNAEFGLTISMNAGMYETDYRSNTGFLRHGTHLNNPNWKPNYQSILVFEPRSGSPKGTRTLEMLDLDSPGAREQSGQWNAAIQNLRILKGQGVNVWKAQPRRWSEAAVGVDAEGRLLLLFCRTPQSMFEFGNRLLELPLGIVRAMHVEGGPEASLSIHAPGLKLDLSGSWESGFNENDGNDHQWPLPNVIGVVAGPPKGAPAAKP